MKIKICPECQTHNSFSAWNCTNCGQTLSIDTVVDLADDQVQLAGETQVEGGPENLSNGDNLASPESEREGFQPPPYYTREKKQHEPIYRERPGCLTAYAGLAIAVGVISVLGVGLSLLSVPFADNVGLFCWSLLIPALAIATGVGIWYMKKWAWWLVVITQSLNAILSLISLTQSPIGLVGLLIAGILLYWFLTNRHLFEDDYLPVESGRKNTWLLVLSVLAVPLSIICVIVILTLLGPSIGNVFSNISNSLAP